MEEMGASGSMFTTWYPYPPPPCLVESWGYREFFHLVFESKGLISKYSGIRTYAISCRVSGLIGLRSGVNRVKCQFSKNAEMDLGQLRGPSSETDTRVLPNQTAIVALDRWACL